MGSIFKTYFPSIVHAQNGLEGSIEVAAAFVAEHFCLGVNQPDLGIHLQINTHLSCSMRTVVCNHNLIVF